MCIGRDYTQGRSKCSWLFLSRLAASKEYAFMSALHAHGFPTPQPLDHSRHVVAMSRIHGNPISQIRSGRLEDPKPVFLQCIAIISRLASHGLIHCDFNEFNLMLDESNMIILIDFPQMVSFEHPNAEELFERDLNGLVKFFATKMRYTAAIEVIPSFSGVIASTQLSSDFNAFLNGVLEQSGFSKEDNDSLGKYLNAVHNSEIIGEGEDGGIEADGEEVESVSRHSYCADLGIADAHLKENLPVEDAEEAEIEGDNTDDDIEVSGDDVSIAVAGIEKLLTDSRSIKERVQKGRLGPCHTGTSKSSRNSTKKRNKYGRVVKTSIEF
jgi:RIO kinase 2